jgi:HlyD family secretion protein
VKEVIAGLNMRVRAGQIMAQLDPAPYEDQVARARARLAQAEKEVKSLQSSLPTLEAELKAVQANLARLQAVAESSRTEAARAANLFQQGILRQDQHDQSQESLHQAEAQVREAEATHQASRSRLDKSLAQVEEARSRLGVERGVLQQAESNLRSTAILSPMDGVVVARTISPGQPVETSPAAPPLFSIAPDLRRMQVRVRTASSDVAPIHVGTEVMIQVDDFPAEILRGIVTARQPTGELRPGVETYDTIVEFENRDERLLPGTFAYVTVPAGQALNILKVPNAALRFTPEIPRADLAALYEKYGIPASATMNPQGEWQVVWRLNGRRRMEPVSVRLGLTDHNFTQLLEGNLSEGDTLVTGRWMVRRPRPSRAAASVPQGTAFPPR